MEGFLTFIIILFLFFWLIARFGPLLLAWWIKKKVGKFTQENRMYPQGEENYREGETILKNSNSSQNKVVDRNIGEYVDYEETKEETKEKN
ncbi:MAG: hypothetical protein WC833_06970 [Bacteroidales bacterium]|jgi:hypothetical protein